MDILTKFYLILFLTLGCMSLKAQPTISNPGNYVEILPTDSKEAIIRKAAHVKPSPKQMAWQEMELTAFLHFGINTFTNREWGDGKEDPQLFNPQELDARQWVKTCKEAGMKLIILTAKHHDGFCLWPSQYTNHSVKSSPWKNGKGDVVRELANACREQDMKLGIYLSPWDRNSPIYGTEAYNDYFVNQLTELLTKYGEVAEVWFDGANGEGPNGKKQVYDWQRYYTTIRRLQPKAVIAIVGPDVRWVGTESGYGRDTEWSVVPANIQDEEKIAAQSQQKAGTFRPKVNPMAKDLGSREKLYEADRLVWYPSEVDVSIRPGWFYHQDQDEKVKSVEKLLDIYYSSVGKNSVLLLNIPPDKRGLIHENDADTLRKWRQAIDMTFRKNLAANAAIQPGSNIAKLIDQDYGTYWQVKEEAPELEIDLGGTQAFDRLLLQEKISVGQRVEAFKVEAQTNEGWVEITSGTTIGYKRLLRFPTITTEKVRLSILQSRANPALAEFGLYHSSSANIKPSISGGGEANPQLKTHPEALKSFLDKRFGMFIHWGPVALRGEEISWSRGTKIPIEEYDNLYKEFNPILFDAEEWVIAARDAGMKYIVLTTRHHDGFSLWDSKYSEYDMAATPYGKGVIQALADACKKHDIDLGFYYSICDWWHADYPVIYPDSAYTFHTEKAIKDPAVKAKMDRYISFIKNQLKELIDAHDPFVIWFDGEWEWAWTHEMGMDLYAYLRGLKDDLLINNRVDKGREGMAGTTKSNIYAGDFSTPEQRVGNFDNLNPWETCMTIATQWAWKANDKLKSKKECIHTLLHTVGGDGNLLFNVGPMMDGRIEQRQVDRLKEMGDWLKINGEAVYGTRGGPYKPTGELVSTRKENRIYLHLLTPPGKTLTLPFPPNRKVEKAWFLNGKIPVKVSRGKQSITIALPETLPDEVASVIVLELNKSALEIELME